MIFIGCSFENLYRTLCTLRNRTTGTAVEALGFLQ